MAKVDGKPDDRDIDIYDTDATCASPPQDPQRQLYLRIKGWAPGMSYNLDFSEGRSVSLIPRPGFQSITFSGRVEIAASGQTVGVRASTSDDGKVEGTVPAVICS